MLCSARAIALLLGCTVLTICAAGVHASRETATQVLVANTLLHVRALQHSIYTFWACHGVDREYGGFHGTLRRDGTPTNPTAKGLVQMTRHAWAFSTFYERKGARPEGHQTTCSDGAAADQGTQAVAAALSSMHASLDPAMMAATAAVNTTAAAAATLAADLDEPAAGPGHARHIRPPTSKDMAQTAFEFVAEHMHDSTSGMFVWNVSRDGRTVIQDNTVLYGEWFVLYSFSKYFAVFHVPEARQYALSCFRAVDAAWHNSSTGGYKELVSNNFPGGTDAPDTILPRTLNVMMHGTEALTALHRATSDPVVLLRILEYLAIICTKLRRVRGLLFEAYVPGASPHDMWQPAPDQVVNYGHNLESTWLVADTLDYLLSIGAISEALAAQYRATSMSFGQAAVRDGYDTQHSGMFESGTPTDGPQSKVKVWWIQAEGMLGLWKLYKYTGEESYLQQLADTARFARKFVNDNVFGELFWQVEADGTHTVWNDIDKNTKGNRWKASYHSSRLVLFLEEWMSRDLL